MGCLEVGAAAEGGGGGGARVGAEEMVGRAIEADLGLTLLLGREVVGSETAPVRERKKQGAGEEARGSANAERERSHSSELTHRVRRSPRRGVRQVPRS